MFNLGACHMDGTMLYGWDRVNGKSDKISCGYPQDCSYALAVSRGKEYTIGSFLSIQQG